MHVHVHRLACIASAQPGVEAAAGSGCIREHVSLPGGCLLGQWALLFKGRQRWKQPLQSYYIFIFTTSHLPTSHDRPYYVRYSHFNMNMNMNIGLNPGPHISINKTNHSFAIVIIVSVPLFVLFLMPLGPNLLSNQGCSNGVLGALMHHLPLH